MGNGEDNKIFCKFFASDIPPPKKILNFALVKIAYLVPENVEENHRKLGVVNEHTRKGSVTSSHGGFIQQALAVAGRVQDTMILVDQSDPVFLEGRIWIQVFCSDPIFV